jgi:hypothetical protein
MRELTGRAARIKEKLKTVKNDVKAEKEASSAEPNKLSSAE